jgi:molecular chaperone GrpE
MAKKPAAQNQGRETEAERTERESSETDAEREGREAQEQVERDLDELGEAKRERDEYLELAKRTRADFENYRKRVAKETSEAIARGKAELARRLIPVVDNLERAVEASAVDPGSLTEGVSLVRDELRSTLKGAGVEAYDPTGDSFDPELHEALSTRPDQDAKSGVVLETVEKGYRLDGQVLRPARVVVSE